MIAIVAACVSSESHGGRFARPTQRGYGDSVGDGLRIERYRSGTEASITGLLRRYHAEDPRGTSLFATDRYDGPARGHAEITLCAWSDDTLLGYATALFAQACRLDPQASVHDVEVAIRTDPLRTDRWQVQARLFDGLLATWRDGVRFGKPSALRCRIRLSASRTKELAFFAERGMRCDCVRMWMTRSLTSPLPAPQPPDRVEVRRSPFQSQEHAREYAQREAMAFQATKPATRRVSELSRLWHGGSPIVALAPSAEVVGGVLAYWWSPIDPGFTEHVFVLPGWRRIGVARALLCTAMRYLRAEGRSTARLAVLGRNLPARKLYSSLGYKPCFREIQGSIVIGERIRPQAHPRP